MKKTLLVCPQNLMSHYLRCIVAAEALKDHFDIIFLASPQYNGFVEKHGFTHTAWSYNNIRAILSKSASFDFSWLTEVDLRQQIELLTKVIEHVKPDMILSDALPAVKIAAALSGIRHVALLNHYMSHYYDCVRTLPHGHKAWKYHKYMSEKSWNKIITYAEKVALYYHHKPFRNLRKKYGLPPEHNLFDEFTGNVTLLCDNTTLFPLKKTPASYHTIGPLMYKGDERNAELEQWLKKKSENKTILVTLGSSSGNFDLKIFEADFFSTFNVVIGGTTYSSPCSHIFTCPFVCADSIMPYVSLVICHGGNGSVYQALSNAKPLLMIPAIFEQEWNIARVVALGLGTVYYANRPAEELHAGVLSLLQSSNREALGSIACDIQSENAHGRIRAFLCPEMGQSAHTTHKQIPCDA